MAGVRPGVLPEYNEASEASRVLSRHSPWFVAGEMLWKCCVVNHRMGKASALGVEHRLQGCMSDCMSN